MRELERDLSPHNGQGARRDPVPPLVVVGRGRAGGAIAGAAREAGIVVRACGRDDALAAGRGPTPALLCVPDAAIGEAAAAIVPAIPPLRFVGHVSGASRLDVLAAAGEAGAETFSVHPLQTFAHAGSDLAGAPCAIDASTPDALALAGSLAAALGMRAFELSDEDRVAYHAAAAIASNFLVALEESATEVLARIGVEGGRELLAPLVLRTATNWAEHGPRALTGPIARGDAATVEGHREALRDVAPGLVPLYDELAARTR